MTDPVQKKYLDVQRQYDSSVIRILGRTADDIARRIRLLDIQDAGVGPRVRSAQLKLVLAQINEQLSNTLGGQLGAVVASGQRAAAKAAQDSAQSLDKVLLRAVGGDGARIMLESMQATAEAGLETDAVRRRKELSPRVFENYRNTANHIEDTIRSGIIAGSSARELAADVRGFISPSTPGGASYASMRLARTELNNAFHEQQKLAGDKPWVQKMRWHLSGSHPKPDLCNTYAGQHDGLYDVKDVPDKPHPMCLCFLTPVADTPEEFLNKLGSGQYDTRLEDQGIHLADVPSKTRIDHSNCTHPRTPAGRAACRKLGGKEGTAVKVDTPHIPRVVEPKVRVPVKTGDFFTGEDLLDAASKIFGMGTNRTRERLIEVFSQQGKLMGGKIMRALSEVGQLPQEKMAGPTVLAQYHPGLGRIAISKKTVEFDDRMFTQKVKGLENSGWFSKTAEGVSGFDRTVSHEMGHFLEDVILNSRSARSFGQSRAGAGFIASKRLSMVFDEIADAFNLPRPAKTHMVNGKNLPIIPGNIPLELNRWVKQHEISLTFQVSEYGATSYKELFAEIWAAYSRDPHGASSEIKRIGAFLEKLIKEFSE